MSVLPPPAATLVRVLGATVRLGLAPSAAASSPSLHMLAGTVTRCGHRTSTAWRALPGPEAPALRLCRRCLAALPADVRTKLVPTPAELARLYERQARASYDEHVETLARLRTDALVDGAAYERTTLVEAKLADRPDSHDRFGYRTMTRAALRERAVGLVAASRELTLLELLNLADPSRTDDPYRRTWLGMTWPAPGSPVSTGGTYDERLWMGRKR